MESGRSTMGVIARELSEMTATSQDGVTNFHFAASPGYVPTAVNLLGGVQRANSLQDVTFMRRANDEWMATAYRIQYADSGVGTLYRMVTNGLATTNAFDLGGFCYAVCTSKLPLYDATQIRPAPVATNGFYPVLEGVVHFRIEVSDTDGNFYPLYNITNANVPYTVVGDSRAGRYTIAGDETKGYAFTGSALPAFVDVELAVLEPAALTRFKYRAESDGPGYPKARAYLAEQAGRLHVFRQRIPIRAASADSGDGP
jgi:hypothetical protein